MSGVLKGIGKVFRSIGKIVKRVALPLLAIGAIVFTGGAALGLAPFAGGFGAAVAGGLSAVGLPVTGAIGSALTGAVTQAGFGAAIGGGIAAATGQDIGNGMALGAAGGAITGGVGGFLSPTAAPAAAGVTQSARNMPAGLGGAPAVPGALPAPASPAAFSPAPTPQFATAAAQHAVAGAVPAAAPAGLGSSVRTGLGKFLESPIAGQAIAGGAQGLIAGMAAKDAGEDDHYQDYRESYDIGPQEGASLPQTAGRPSVADRFGRPEPVRGRWRYNRQSGDVEYG